MRQQLDLLVAPELAMRPPSVGLPSKEQSLGPEGPGSGEVCPMGSVAPRKPGRGRGWASRGHYFSKHYPNDWERRELEKREGGQRAAWWSPTEKVTHLIPLPFLLSFLPGNYCKIDMTLHPFLIYKEAGNKPVPVLWPGASHANSAYSVFTLPRELRLNSPWPLFGRERERETQRGTGDVKSTDTGCG